MKGIAIIVAAGKSERAGVDKVWVRSGGKTVVERAADPFFSAGTVDEAIVVVRKERLNEARRVFSSAPLPCTVIAGGEDRTESVRLALYEAKRLAGQEDAVVAIHDGARPYLTRSLIERAMTLAAERGSAVPVVPCTDSLRRRKASGSEVLPREEVLRVQTPQCFLLDRILAAYASGDKATDDATLYEKAFGAVTLTDGEPQNEKITYLSDLYKDNLTRVGVGYDAHELTPDRPLILGGVTIPHDKGLLGHSDADALTHAIMDALLTAAGLPDIGHLFPPSDPKYKGANSVLLLKTVVAKLRAKGFVPENVSATVLAEKPKLAPYLTEMERTIADAAGVEPSAVKFAATTTEGLGIIGQEKGIAAHAVALIRSIH